MIKLLPKYIFMGDWRLNWTELNAVLDDDDDDDD